MPPRLPRVARAATRQPCRPSNGWGSAVAWVLMAVGLVLVVEGLVFALAPSRLDGLVEMMARIPPETRRLIGLVALALGVGLIALARALGLG